MNSEQNKSEELVSVNVVAGVVLVKDGKYLLVQEKQPAYYGKWNLPAEKVEAGDSIEETAIKKVREESGFEVELLRKVGIYQETATRPPKHVFLASITGGELAFPEDEILDAKWFSVEEIEGMKDRLRDTYVLDSILNVHDKRSAHKPGVDFIGVTVSFFCNDGNGNWLLHKRSRSCRDERGNWDFGGGKLEFGEDFEAGVLREVKEEYGCKGEIQLQLPTQNRLREHEGKKTHWVSIGFIIKVDPNKAQLNEPAAMDEIGWFKMDSLPNPLHTSAKKRLMNQSEYFKRYNLPYNMSTKLEYGLTSDGGDYALVYSFSPLNAEESTFSISIDPVDRDDQYSGGYITLGGEEIDLAIERLEEVMKRLKTMRQNDRR